MHLTRVKNRNGVITTLVRESYRDRNDGKVKKRTLANLSKLPEHAQEVVAKFLAGEDLVPAQSHFEVLQSKTHGHVDAVLHAMRRLGIDRMLGLQKTRERSLVMGMIAARILAPGSKLDTTRWWRTTSLAETLDIENAHEDELYRAMDWLLERQPSIEKKLAQRHLEPCGLVLYDLTSTWVEGTKCPLAARGYSRDGKAEKLQVTFGLMTDEDGRPVSVNVYSGNTADPSTVQTQVEKLKEDFGLDLVVFVGDRGMLAQSTIDRLVDSTGIEWITALKSGAIRKLRSEGSLQLGLFDEKSLFEFESAAYPGERLVACRNPELAERRARKRQEFIEATRSELIKIQAMIGNGRLHDRAAIGLRAGRVINKYKVAKHFKLTIEDGRLIFRVDRRKVEAEAALDGIYVVRTSVAKDALSTDDVVRSYKRLAKVEKNFRSMKASGLQVRPIHHHLENRVRAHIFLCMLAQYVRWHLEKAWSELLFGEEEDHTPTRDPVKAATPSAKARRKRASKKNDEGGRIQSLKSLLRELSTIVKNTCRQRGTRNETFELTTRPNELQGRALELVRRM